MPWPCLQQQVACRCNLKISCSLSTQFVSFLTWSFPFTTMWDTSIDPPIQSFCCLCKPGYMRELISPGIALGQWQTEVQNFHQKCWSTHCNCGNSQSASRYQCQTLYMATPLMEPSHSLYGRLITLYHLYPRGQQFSLSRIEVISGYELTLPACSASTGNTTQKT